MISIGGKTPFEAFFGRKPDVAHMRVWYADAYAHQPKDLGVKKLGEHGRPVKFLGYPEGMVIMGICDNLGKEDSITH